ncbi:small VCP/p97-interacting protein isoform X1 [Rhineura floridana]|uniref:small VCP/p97-interacting protein isoform X1 n=1 Tax=Rhineura floridana TaxID=261503 RepID=UPI002AC8325A|nr:small VCP/p97-interacting protein isoform X1 [Rhineura floridana]
MYPKFHEVAYTSLPRYLHREGTLGVEMKRRQLAEAAEKRQMEAASRGIKNLTSIEEKRRKQEEMEKRLESAGPGPEGGGLRWQVG